MTLFKTILVRSALALAAGLLISAVISEISFRLLRNTSSRAPTVIELSIPPGTAVRVAEGESVLPKDMSLVAGDTLVVNNQDSVAHTLGPMYIPAGTSAMMIMFEHRWAEHFKDAIKDAGGFLVARETIPPEVVAALSADLEASAVVGA